MVDLLLAAGAAPDAGADAGGRQGVRGGAGTGDTRGGDAME
jgi:hypothetical protein